MFDLRVEEAIARLSLSRPEARNAIPLPGWEEMAVKTNEAQQAGASVLILSGIPGGVFCAGADIAGFDRLLEEPSARTEFRQAIRIGLDGLSALAIPTIALIEGACYGAGVALTMACDIRMAGGSAQFAITPAKLGISYPQEDVHRLVSLIGAGQAARLLFSAASIGGAEAERIGLVEQFHEQGAAAAAEALAAAIATNDGDSLRTLKSGVRLAAAGIVHDEGQDGAFDALFGSAGFARRVAGYRSSRK